MATNVQIGDPAYSLIGDSWPRNPFAPGTPTYPQPWTPQPYPTIYPTVEPLVWPTKTGTRTTTGPVIDLGNQKRIKELETLLRMAHEELLSGDDDDALALCELIEEAIGVEG